LLHNLKSNDEIRRGLPFRKRKSRKMVEIPMGRNFGQEEKKGLKFPEKLLKMVIATV